MKTKTKSSALALELGLLEGKSIEEIAGNFSKNKRKKGTKFMGLLHRTINAMWTDDVEFSSMLYNFVLALIVVVNVGGGLFVRQDLSMLLGMIFGVLAFYLLGSSANYYKNSKKTEALGLVILSSFISTTALSFVFGGLAFLSLLVPAGYLAWTARAMLQTRRDESQIAVSDEMDPDEIAGTVKKYMGDFIERHRARLIGPDTEYGRHVSALKSKAIEIQTSINYWVNRSKMEGVDQESVLLRIETLERLKEGVDEELRMFNEESKGILDRLSALEAQLPILSHEINDHYQDRLISRYESDIEGLARESERITVAHMSRMREELLGVEQAINILRLKAVPLLNGGIKEEIDARADEIALLASPELAIVGSSG